MNPLKELQRQGQAVWMDYIRRDLLVDGGLERLVREDGVTGVTSNPAIFEAAIGSSDMYDDEVRELLVEAPDATVDDIYRRLVISDIRMAADILRPVWETTHGADGYVSLEVSPHLARDTDGTLRDARSLWAEVGRPNLMIKVPATAEGIPAVEELLAEGIQVNITLMFSLSHYEAVAQAYLRALNRLPDPAGAASVASFFVSRVDSKLDATLDALGGEATVALRGRIAIANSKMAYRRFREIFHGEAFHELRQRGARPQRVLWASTSTKDPAYRDVLYVEELVGPETVNTIPPDTLDAFREHGVVRPSLEEDLAGAEASLQRLHDLGIDLGRATEELQSEGVAKFVTPFDQLMQTLSDKRATILESLQTSSSS